ncbi:hypothetical protein J2X76_004767 [Neorhizobium sp. 2083]|uniref:hypothetical protein n=1 Tax=Neorhizobium sp. 2083 TaxID=2817762 RepID=UPI002859868C|nr:hypothetical protein [Neorhizobium sp. 2083]MDR6819575.1 hypothetical protein [Neorhizobium sp. 2083]
MQAQRYYWDTFTNLKRDQIYFSLHHHKLDGIERWQNIISAIAASTAIAGWAVWQYASFLWGFIIAASQVLTAVKPHLPYGRRLKSLEALCPEIEVLALTAETDWWKVSRGMLTEEEIFSLATALKQKTIAATDRHSKGLVLPEDSKLLALADQRATAYMKTFSEE